MAEESTVNGGPHTISQPLDLAGAGSRRAPRSDGRAKDEQAAEEILAALEERRNEFYAYVLRSLWDPKQADDVFSSAVLAAYENRQKFRPGTNARAWIYRILTNKCFVANRHTKREGASLDEANANMTPVDDTPAHHAALTDPAAFLDQVGDEVYAAMRKLSEAERSCLLLRSMEEFSYQEIAEIMEMPKGTVMTHLARGRAKLRKELTEYARQRGVIRG